MKIEVFKEKMISYLKEIKIDIHEEQINKFYEYMNILLEWNEKINLTTIKDPEEIILKHFVDSLTILKYIEENAKIIDVGSGAGFPGIPLKIMREDIELTLLDSLNNRISFLKEVNSKLRLNKITFIHGRAEELAHDKSYRESYDVATSRAVANLSTLSEYLLPFVKIGGYDISMKGNEIEKEVEGANNAINKLGGSLNKIEKFNLPKSDMKRNIVLILKEQHTPKDFPRKAGTPSKEPLM